MKLLLDTHLLLWAAGQTERLSAQARSLLLEPAQQLFFSSASLWEITIKCGLGRSDFAIDPRRLWRMLPAHGYRELAVNGEHAIMVGSLPHLHKDPFDRMLLAQARVEGMTLLTSDATLAAYGEGVMLV